MPNDIDFDALMTRLRNGDEAAAEEIFQRFAQRLIDLARSRLDERLRQKVDPEDIMQSAFASFFLRHADDQYDLKNWDSLWALLTVLTLRKCGFRTRHFRAQRRDHRRETAPQLSPEDSHAGWEAISRDPTPSEALMLDETIEQVLSGLDERDQQIAKLALQQYTSAEIAFQVGCSERTVQRLLERIKKRLRRLGTDDATST